MADVIRLLPEQLVNQIAAGEVIERPASALKELLENAIDAGATRISIELERGGLSSLIVSDNGRGMSCDELPVAVQRHATSKLPDDDLFQITHFGFRGEALPSIGAVSSLSLTSRVGDVEHGWRLDIVHGAVGVPRPAACAIGTRIEITDLFGSVPARLKFLKTERTEAGQCIDVVRRLAMCRPDIGFQMSDSGKAVFSLPAQPLSDEGARQRLSALVGRTFADEAIAIDSRRDEMHLTGLAGLPTMNRQTASHIYLFVNDRPVRDRQLLGAVRAGYQDMLPRGRHPVLVLFLSMPPGDVDVNVHPAKAEVRFSDPQRVRGLFVGSLMNALSDAGLRATQEGSEHALRRFQSAQMPTITSAPASPDTGDMLQGQQGLSSYMLADAPPAARIAMPSQPETMAQGAPAEASFPLGAARAQLHKTYVIAETGDGIVLVDQHAAHERLVMERMKEGLAEGPLASQTLLLPEVVDIPIDQYEAILGEVDMLNRLGLQLEGFGQGSLLVRGVPALLGEASPSAIVRDIGEELSHLGGSTGLQDRLNAVIASISCHGSVRAGRQLGSDEMNALLRQMEETPAAGQCNHGRPTFITLSLSDLEKLFHRS
ncbi:MAG: DNA mismatch repair endonuclease MutL [Alphaproteobacteria bacterium]|jgi:DNA mismatch repair protein MutL|nr:DNA mismatch repair endonuclease MutL [SAR116 cluster bacterium]MBT5482318.1 DNA mismatch repair endonuclease MutL [Alphaproteobacteria bacterium]MBT5729634.1 DNA mismatch repair endonuclease MutL [Alphaproteobacteria bacterium]MDA8881991.1 DNA mismatch repair endonuclease MutL [Alphaproteobacteria bacterium]MDG1412561.1 DNA mismatch repair endonuclease MutL [Alphaproteobacteria bacterium]